MANIFIGNYPTNEEHINRAIDSVITYFQNTSHKVDLNGTSIGLSQEEEISRSIEWANVIVFIFDETLASNADFISKASIMVNLAMNATPHKLVVPVVMPSATIGNLPNFLRQFVGIKLNDFSKSSFDRLCSRLATTATKADLEHEEKLQIKAEVEKMVEKQQINNSAGIFVRATKRQLKIREKALRWNAYICYGLGLFCIIVGIVLTFIFATNSADAFHEKPIALVNELKAHPSIEVIKALNEHQVNWSLTAYLAIKSVIIISLLIAAAKYCFGLAQSFMIESLKLADRSHAIGFGQFYLEVYEQKIDPEELKTVFRDWNISNNNSAFSARSSNEWDPKVLKKATKIVTSILDKKDKIKENK